MLINGHSKNKTEFLVHKYNELIKSGVKEENILVITLNAYKKSFFPKNSKTFTFWGLCYNAFNDNWEYISTLIGSSTNEVHKPNLCGLEVSQFIFKPF